VKEFKRADGNALHLLPLIIPEKFLGFIVSIYFMFVSERTMSAFDRLPKQTESHSGVFPQRPMD